MSDRKAFEKAYHKETGLYASWAPNNKGYTDVIAGMCYRIWQAAQAQAGDGEAVGWQYQHEDTGRTTFVSHAEASEFEELNSRRWHKTMQLYTAPPAAKVNQQLLEAVKVCASFLSDFGLESSDAYQQALSAIEAAQGQE